MESIDGLFTSMSKLAVHNTHISTTLGARALVLGKFMEAATSRLTATQCVEIRSVFKSGIEDVMALMDDTPLPEAFHSELLALTNSIMRRLGEQQG
jgi:DNA-binding FadR family transcriptional regulator